VAKASAAVSPCARTKAGVNQRAYKEYTITNFDNIMDVNDRRKSEGTRPVLQVYNLVASDGILRAVYVIASGSRRVVNF